MKEFFSGIFGKKDRPKDAPEAPVSADSVAFKFRMERIELFDGLKRDGENVLTWRIQPDMDYLFKNRVLRHSDFQWPAMPHELYIGDVIRGRNDYQNNLETIPQYKRIIEQHMVGGVRAKSKDEEQHILEVMNRVLQKLDELARISQEIINLGLDQ